MANFEDAIVTVAAAGTPVPLGSGKFLRLYVMAHDDNTGVMHVGASTVVSSVLGTARGTLVPQQFPSDAGAFVPLLIEGPGDLAELFVDAATSGDSCTWFGLTDS